MREHPFDVFEVRVNFKSVGNREPAMPRIPQSLERAKHSKKREAPRMNFGKISPSIKSLQTHLHE